MKKKTWKPNRTLFAFLLIAALVLLLLHNNQEDIQYLYANF